MDRETIKRYTNIASLVAILKNKELTLLDPSKWEDKNDAHYLLKYRDKKGFNSINVLCFTKAPETSHHWKVFAPGADGVCIRMHTDRFLSYLESIKEIKHGNVEYKFIDEVENDDIKVDQLPFLKRKSFTDEAEYRIILGNEKKNKKKSNVIEFEISLIEKILLSNALPNDLKKPMVELIKGIDGCSNLIIHRSTLNDNARWKKACERAI